MQRELIHLWQEVARDPHAHNRARQRFAKTWCMGVHVQGRLPATCCKGTWLRNQISGRHKLLLGSTQIVWPVKATIELVLQGWVPGPDSIWGHLPLSREKARIKGLWEPPETPYCSWTERLCTPRPHIPHRGPGCSHSSCSPWYSFWTPPSLSTPPPGRWRLGISQWGSCSCSLWMLAPVYRGF